MIFSACRIFDHASKACAPDGKGRPKAGWRIFGAQNLAPQKYATEPLNSRKRRPKNQRFAQQMPFLQEQRKRKREARI